MRRRIIAALTFTGLIGVGVAAFGATDAGLNAQDRLFLRSAHQGHLAEISGARIAQHRSATTSVRELATRWITDHTALDLRLSQAAVALDVVLPAGPDAAQEAVEARYRAAATAEFDELWVSAQITAHHRAGALVEAELRVGSSAAVKTLARELRPVIATHHRLLAAAAPAAGVVVPAEENAPPPGAVRTTVPTPRSAPPPGWRVTESPGTPGWTRPSPETSGATLSPIPIPGGPGPSLTVGAGS
ncbi:DUF4142 domain-containing protein [Cryptosporangium arvum]|uniref:DUF4142 domain-containing protein n=1 Tax=Cryptosporangium arvum TaxID=80871 RepID=UPI0004BA80CA|nr:DUF4142 domain-containing protein [Cryptosporangium arvum]